MSSEFVESTTMSDVVMSCGVVAAIGGNSDEEIPARSIASSTSGGPLLPVPVDEGTRYRLKRRKIKMAGAPKMPLTGYVRYMNERREELRRDQPEKSAIEHTKIIGEEWQALSEERKTPFMKAAQADKERYLRELHVFLHAHPDVLADQLARKKIARKNVSASGNAVSSTGGVSAGGSGVSSSVRNLKSILKNTQPRTIRRPRPRPRSFSRSFNYSPMSRRSPPIPLPLHERQQSSGNVRYGYATSSVTGEVPIYTPEFIELNRGLDQELRVMRKKKTDLEQQSAALEKHVESLRNGVERLRSNNDEMEEKNRLLSVYLHKMKIKLALALSDVPLPTKPHGATIDNIDSYLHDVYRMSNDVKALKEESPACLINAREIIKKLDLKISL